MLVHIHSIYFIKFLGENSFGFYPYPNCLGFIHFPCCSTFPNWTFPHWTYIHHPNFPKKVYPHFQISFCRCCFVSIFLHLEFDHFEYSQWIYFIQHCVNLCAISLVHVFSSYISFCIKLGVANNNIIGWFFFFQGWIMNMNYW
jgi:hypothetical protein